MKQGLDSKIAGDLRAMLAKLTDKAEWDVVWDIVRSYHTAWRQEESMKRRSDFTTGQTVTFKPRKTLPPMTGTVARLNPTKAQVKVGFQMWNVPYSMLTAVNPQ